MTLRHFIILLLSFALTIQVSHAQYSEVDLRPALVSGEKAYYKLDFRRALKFYMIAYSLDSSIVELNLRIGVCKYLIENDKEICIPFLQFATKGGHIEALFYLGLAYHATMDFDNALKCYNEYLNFEMNPELGVKDFSTEEIEHKIAITKYAISAVANPVNVKIENLGGEVNTMFPDYGPVLSMDENMLLFTTRRPSNRGPENRLDGLYFEDIYSSVKENGEWTKPRNLGHLINSAKHESAVGISPDGQLMFIYKSNDYGSGDLYYARQNRNGWGGPLIYRNDIKSAGIESGATITENGRIIYFCSDRIGGEGGMDLYKTQLLPNGTWGLATNLGPTINTSGDEESPFIHPDGSKLFFSSTGHENMGGHDIFQSNLIDTTWSKPKNLGYPINTVQDDLFFVLSTDGRRGYYSTIREDGFGASDIYVIYMNGEEINGVLIGGEVTSTKQGEKPFRSEKPILSIVDEASGELIGKYTPNGITGKYVMLLNPGPRYKLVVKALNHKTYIDTFEFKNTGGFQEIMKNIKLEYIAATEPEPEPIPEPIVIPEPEPEIIPEYEEDEIFSNLSWYGLVTDSKTKDGLGGVRVQIVDQSTGEAFTFITIDTGEFVKSIGDKKKDEKAMYSVELSKEGYFTKSLNVEVVYKIDGKTKFSDLLDFSMDVEVKNLSDLVQINAIGFDVNKSDIRQDAAIELDKIVKIMTDYKEMVVELGSHTDCRGSEKYNMKLSDKRAKASANYISGKITDPDRITGIGYGESELVNDCGCEGKVKSDCTDEQHAENRRTTFQVVSTGSDLLKVDSDKEPKEITPEIEVGE
ncbi:MAG: PD40 domain-containing protein [Flavobacteriales bacterium]|nr:PD40 domain-containing protein [Flavobacteriales bacterium]